MMTYGSERLPIDLHSQNIVLIDALALEWGKEPGEVLSLIIHHGCNALRSCMGEAPLPECPAWAHASH